MNKIVYYIIMAAGVLISSFSQMLLKRSASKKYSKWIYQYLNVRVISAYAMFFGATICTVIAMRQIPLSMAPVWNSLGIILVTLMGRLFFKEKLGKKKIFGLCIVIMGIVIFSI